MAVTTVSRAPRRHITGQNRQINIKASKATIAKVYRIADVSGRPLGAMLKC